jgi:hypothetical protein
MDTKPKQLCTAEHQKYVPSDDCGSSQLQRAASEATFAVQRDACCSHEAATVKTLGIADCGCHHDLHFA